jgi:hypothetical protein
LSFARALRAPQFIVLTATFFLCCSALVGLLLHAIGRGIASMAVRSIDNVEGLIGFGMEAVASVVVATLKRRSNAGVGGWGVGVGLAGTSGRLDLGGGGAISTFSLHRHLLWADARR